MSNGEDAATLRDRVGLALSGADVRIFSRDGQLWLSVNDLVAALGVPRRQLDYHVGHLPDDEKRHIPRPSRLPPDIVVGASGLHCVSLTGMFKLLLSIRSPPAEAFQSWVCRALLIPLWEVPQHDAPPRTPGWLRSGLLRLSGVTLAGTEYESVRASYGPTMRGRR